MQSLRPLVGFIALLALAFLLSCGNPAPPITIALSPSSAQTDQGSSITITAMLTNDSSGRGVSWSLSGPGSLTTASGSSVSYVAPAPSSISTVQTATLSAASLADPTKTASLQISVNPLPYITSAFLPAGNVGSPYSQAVAERGGTAPFTWSMVYGAMPAGLSIASGTGTISGTPTAGGTWYFEVQLTDAAGVTATQPFLSIEVYANSAGGNPVPFVNQPLVPDTVAPGGQGFTLTVNGTAFLAASTVNINGTALATSFVNSRQLTATIPAADIATAGTAFITVVNPAPGGGRSNAIPFPVAPPATATNFVNAAASPLPAYFATAVAVGDFNNDGKADLAFAYNIRVATMLGNGDGTFSQAPGSPITIEKPPWDTLPSPYVDSLALGDFNNSGQLGMAAAGMQNMNVTILQGNGTGAFTPSSAFVYTQGQPTVCVVAGDFNGDGNLDLATASQLNGLPVSVSLGYGDGAFNSVSDSPFGVSTGANSLAVGDFNGDGKLDLAVATNGVIILLGNGDGTFTQSQGSPIPIGIVSSIAAADFNGDGKLDLAATDSAGNAVSILLGNGDGTFSQAPGSPAPVGFEPDSIAVGDFTNSGKAGLAVANFGSNSITVLLGNGDGTFSESAGSPIPVGQGPYSVAVGDFNGSGRLGLAVANLNDGSVSVLLQQ